ncbi:MAG: division/cell wall cluster transcriptional repressor MraZ [Humidesulfovibrio sp.]|uniref:division/cell wall cluster transcriptional repressor MraZ n=1 Tax=Humidesulfovibrio sp. TaxID=2910988 RepID=UPI002732A7B0|nr:division/cell wall cluster transcriptional repressor MraZ [Humidesulfovibrio sp.]MDP2847458.1 division/cell wall cluster transcriptional repressor MraZ [Humidesulfovibrio sp.]
MRLLGHAHRSLDSKGRLMLTPEFRDQFLAASPDGRLVLTIYQGQIIGITPAQWDIFAAELETKLTSPSPMLQDVRRVAFAGYSEVVLDKQGRIQLPTHLRKSGRLGADVVLVGVGRCFEIWDKDRFEALLEQRNEDVSAEMAKADIKLPF